MRMQFYCYCHAAMHCRKGCTWWLHDSLRHLSVLAEPCTARPSAWWGTLACSAHGSWMDGPWMAGAAAGGHPVCVRSCAITYLPISLVPPAAAPQGRWPLIGISYMPRLPHSLEALCVRISIFIYLYGPALHHFVTAFVDVILVCRFAGALLSPIIGNSTWDGWVGVPCVRACVCACMHVRGAGGLWHPDEWDCGGASAGCRPRQARPPHASPHAC